MDEAKAASKSSVVSAPSDRVKKTATNERAHTPRGAGDTGTFKLFVACSEQRSTCMCVCTYYTYTVRAVSGTVTGKMRDNEKIKVGPAGREGSPPPPPSGLRPINFSALYHTQRPKTRKTFI